MKSPFDAKKTLEVIEQLKTANIGKQKKWDSMIKKIKNDISLNPAELEYYSSLTRIYKDSATTKRSKIYHTRLSEHDEKSPCHTCGDDSDYYCNMNDQYFCTIHVVGHDDNEF